MKLRRVKERDLFSVSSREGNLKRKKRDGSETSQRETKRKKAKEEFRAQLEPLSFENITEGQMILACILEVCSFEITVSLPNKMTAHLPITNISKAYTQLLLKASKEEEVSEPIYNLSELFTEGQILITKVKEILPAQNDKMRVVVSILPEDVNRELSPSLFRVGTLLQGAVTSSEENGFILDIGFRSIRAAFLANEDAPSGVLGVGNVFLCWVKQILDSGEDGEPLRIKLTSKVEEISAEDNEKIETLSAGVITEALVIRAVGGGLQLQFGENQEGFVSRDHLAGPDDSVDNYSERQEVQVRILYVADFTSVIHCTLNTSMLQNSRKNQAMGGLKVGDVIENAKVCRSSIEGVHLALPHDIHGFCSANKLRDSRITEGEVKNLYPVGAVTNCRIIRTHPMDQLCIVSLRKAIFNEQVIGKEELTVGQKLNVKILEHFDTGVTVALSEHAKGFIPKLHLPDSGQGDQALKYPVGHTFKARVLRLVTGMGPNLTLKKELVKSDLPIVSSCDINNQGVITYAAVVKVYPYGLLLEMFGGAKAMLPAGLVPREKRDLEKSFKEGMVVKCKIIFVSVSESKMKASLLFGDDAIKKEGKNDQIKGSLKARDTLKTSPVKTKNETSKGHAKPENDLKNKSDPSLVLKSSDIVDCVVTSVKEEKVLVKIKGKGTKGIIPKCHLADNVPLCEALFKLLKKGDRIERVIAFDKKQKTWVLSAKPFVYHHVKKSIEKDKEYVSVHSSFPSVVSAIEKHRVRITVMDNTFGQQLHISKNYFSGMVKLVEYAAGVDEGQTVVVFLQGVKNGIPFCCSTLEYFKNDETFSNLQMLYDHITTERQVVDALRRVDGTKFGEVQIGQHYTATCLYFTIWGALVHIPSLNLDGFIQEEQYGKDTSPVTGEDLDVRVLGINYRENCLELSARTDLEVSLSEDHGVEIGQEINCEILLARREWIMGRLTDGCIGQIVYLPAKRHMNDFKGRQSYYQVGEVYKAIVQYVEGSLILADLQIHCSKRKEPAHVLPIFSERPTFYMKGTLPETSVQSLILSPSQYTVNHFSKEARAKMERIAQYMHKKMCQKKTPKLSTEEKFETLKSDNFSQFDDAYYWDQIVRMRKEKKIEKKKNPVSVKRKAEEVDTEGKCQRTETNKKRKISRKASLSQTKAERPLMTHTFEELDSTKIWDEEKAKLDSNDCLQIISDGFDWTGETVPVREESSSDEETPDDKGHKSVKRLTKFEREELARKEERKTRELELQRLDPDRQPETALDYEEKVEKNPHSSAVWIEYISFHLENAETGKARLVADRALERIPPTLEAERLAVWNVLLRLEVMFGSHDSVQSALREAMATNDELKVFFLMIDIYASSTKLEEGKEIIRQMLKKFSTSPEVWVKAGLFYFQTKQFNEARSLLERSFMSLQKKEHIDVINRFAQFELKYGDAERGITIFEKLLSSFPKRLDIWNVYADLLRKQNDISGARNVLERMTTLKLNMKQMKNVFKKLLDFEVQHGSPQRVEAIKARVAEYVESALKQQ